ncbi:MAG TPA: aldose 1-epimerase family protein [Acetobacteraceae bacterium]|nr:aldose 1-epimerase family protein [Acetobacteraceae bacterium]
MIDRHILSNGYLSAAVKPDGAELCSLRDAEGTELLWQAHPIWPRHAPVLFPIVGRLKDDTLVHRGRSYRMTQHGFARDRRFAWLNRGATSCRLVLHDDGETRAAYPFAFRFEVAFALDDDALEQTYTVVNTGREELPASAGAHPGFVWPLAEGVAKTAHMLAFERPEPAPVRRLGGGLLLPAAEPSPISGDTLSLAPSLFSADALILDQVASRSVRYTAPGAEAIEVSWDGFQQLGVWTRMTGDGDCADFICIEPWHGTASPGDFAGEFRDKPGLMLIPPGERRVLTMRIRLC